MNPSLLNYCKLLDWSLLDVTNKSYAGQEMGDQIYWQGFTVIKKVHQAKREMLRLKNGAIHWPITHHSAREKWGRGRRIAKEWLDDGVEGWWGRGLSEEEEVEEGKIREGAFHYAITGEKTNPPASMRYPAESNNKWEKVKHWLWSLAEYFFLQ